MNVSGVPVPPELRGRLLEIGKPDRLLLSLEQASDLFVEQFAAMKGSPLLGDVDPLASGALVVAHSTGGLDAPLTRRRLAEAGFPNAISRIIALATPFKGSTVISESLATFITALAGAKMNSDEGRKAVRSIDPKNVQKRVPREVAPLVDVSVAAKIGPTPKFRQGKKGAIEAVGNGDIRPMLRFVASGSPVKTIGDLKADRVITVLRALSATPVQTDGLVPVESTKFGRKSIMVTEPHDHAGLFEDPDLIDRAIKALIS
jgi:triacylglycerol esterase/lipase EstA (alpha/beta hydrolase family)